MGIAISKVRQCVSASDSDLDYKRPDGITVQYMQ